MTRHTWRSQGPHKPSSCATFTLSSHWHKKSCVYARRVTSVVSDFCHPADCGLPGFSVRKRGSLGKNTGVYWLTLVAIPFKNTMLPAALATNSPEYLVMPEPMRPKQLPHLHTQFSQGSTQVLQGSLRSTPQWTTHMQRWK